MPPPSLTMKANSKPGKTKGIWILNIPKLSATFGEELSISYSEYSKAAPNCFHFHKSQDSQGPTGPYATWWLNHFGFFSRQHDKVKNYLTWSQLELKEQLNYQSLPTTFDVMYYVQEYVLMSLQAL
ncbi:hypothetical protein F5146DRAFT_1132190 [Armillaria mellea]|nr:hypothetical protein F5146DRAFT_1132190 [Armillaria mellea]